MFCCCKYVLSLLAFSLLLNHCLFNQCDPINEINALQKARHTFLLELLLMADSTATNKPLFLSVAGTLKLSQTSPDVPNSEGGAHPPKDLPNAHSQQQVTSRSAPSSLHPACVVVVVVVKLRDVMVNKNRSVFSGHSREKA